MWLKQEVAEVFFQVLNRASNVANQAVTSLNQNSGRHSVTLPISTTRLFRVPYGLPW